MDNQMSVGVVHIVEWLNAGDAKTGAALFDELEPMGIVSKSPVAAYFHGIDTRDAFVALLRQFEREFQENRRTPIVHIDTHGNEQGMKNQLRMAAREAKKRAKA